MNYRSPWYQTVTNSNFEFSGFSEDNVTTENINEEVALQAELRRLKTDYATIPDQDLEVLSPPNSRLLFGLDLAIPGEEVVFDGDTEAFAVDLSKGRDSFELEIPVAQAGFLPTPGMNVVNINYLSDGTTVTEVEALENGNFKIYLSKDIKETGEDVTLRIGEADSLKYHLEENMPAAVVRTTTVTEILPDGRRIAKSKTYEITELGQSYATAGYGYKSTPKVKVSTPLVGRPAEIVAVLDSSGRVKQFRVDDGGTGLEADTVRTLVESASAGARA